LENNSVIISNINQSESVESSSFYQNHQYFTKKETKTEIVINNEHNQNTSSKKTFKPVILPIEKENDFNKVETIEVIDEYVFNCPKPFIFYTKDGKKEEISEILIEDVIIE